MELNYESPPGEHPYQSLKIAILMKLVHSEEDDFKLVSILTTLSVIQWLHSFGNILTIFLFFSLVVVPAPFDSLELCSKHSPDVLKKIRSPEMLNGSLGIKKRLKQLSSVELICCSLALAYFSRSSQEISLYFLVGSL